MIAANDLIAKFRQALDEGWGYIWGQSGATWTQAKQNAATRSMTVKYGSRWIGRRVADCSGLFAWAFRELGGSIYHGSNTIWQKYCGAQGKLTADTKIRPGTAVFLVKGGNRHHIGLYVGNDTVIEAKGTQYGVVTSRLNHWDEWGELKDVRYDGQPEESFIPLLRKGSQGDAVKTLQENLMALGYSLPKYGADGKFGTETEQAVRAFQARAGLEVDGIYGSKTHAALLAALGNEEGEANESSPANTTANETESSPSTSTSSVKHVRITSSGGKVNVRMGNGLQYARITQAAPSTAFDYVATADNGWHAVKLTSQVGWVSGDYSEIATE